MEGRLAAVGHACYGDFSHYCDERSHDSDEMGDDSQDADDADTDDEASPCALGGGTPDEDGWGEERAEAPAPKGHGRLVCFSSAASTGSDASGEEGDNRDRAPPSPEPYDGMVDYYSDNDATQEDLDEGRDSAGSRNGDVESGDEYYGKERDREEEEEEEAAIDDGDVCGEGEGEQGYWRYGLLDDAGDAESASCAPPCAGACTAPPPRAVSAWASPWAPPKVFAYECVLETGHGEAIGRADRVPAIAAPRVAFDGECYLCGAQGHSQNYCPLSRCHTCHRYGHTERVCCFAARPHGLHTPARAARFAPWRFARFGSGWTGSGGGDREAFPR